MLAPLGQSLNPIDFICYLEHLRRLNKLSPVDIGFYFVDNMVSNLIFPGSASAQQFVVTAGLKYLGINPKIISLIILFL